MKKPLFPSHVNRAVVRSNALLTIIIAVVAASLTSWPLMALLAADFAVRGFLNPRWSLFSRVSGSLLRHVLPFPDKQIFFPPKQFAARVGLIFSLTATVLFVMDFTTAGILVTATLVVFAALECFLNICMGCIVYNSVIAPHRKRRSLDTYS